MAIDATVPFDVCTVRLVSTRAVAVSAAAVRGFSRVQAGSRAASANAGTNVRAMAEVLLAARCRQTGAHGSLQILVGIATNLFAGSAPCRSIRGGVDGAGAMRAGP